MYIPNHHLNIVHEQMLREAMEQHAQRPRRSTKRAPEPKQRRALRAPALLAVKLGKTLESLGQAYLKDEQQCSA